MCVNVWQQNQCVWQEPVDQKRWKMRIKSQGDGEKVRMCQSVHLYQRLCMNDDMDVNRYLSLSRECMDTVPFLRRGMEPRWMCSALINTCITPPQTKQSNKHRANMLSLYTQAWKHTKPRLFSKLPAGSWGKIPPHLCQVTKLCCPCTHITAGEAS